MNYSLVGTGNMAWFLATQLSRAGWTCTGVYGRHADAAALLAAHCCAPVLQSLQDIPDAAAELCLLAVTDTAISTVADAIHLRHTVLAHTSGTSSIRLLHHAAAHAAVFWPVYSIVRGQDGPSGGLPVVWEASDPEARDAILQLAATLSANAFEAAEPQRKQLHLAAVFINNFVNHLVAVGQELCAAQQQPFDLLLPLLRQTCARVEGHAAAELQTGPAKRGDTVTMDRHLELLEQKPEWQSVYRAISASIDKMYRAEPDQ